MHNLYLVTTMPIPPPGIGQFDPLLTDWNANRDQFAADSAGVSVAGDETSPDLKLLFQSVFALSQKGVDGKSLEPLGNVTIGSVDELVQLMVSLFELLIGIQGASVERGIPHESLHVACCVQLPFLSVFSVTVYVVGLERPSFPPTRTAKLLRAAVPATARVAPRSPTTRILGDSDRPPRSVMAHLPCQVRVNRSAAADSVYT